MLKTEKAALTRKRKPLIALVVALLVPFIVAAIGGGATSSALSDWYRTLRKPEWNPPDWIFGPVWTTLYLIMGIASWLVWRKGQEAPEEQQKEVQGALTLYGFHLVLNLLWSLIFFGLRRVDLALIEIGALWVALLATLIRFYRIRPLAGLILIPYQAWVTFAATLNATIWQLNR